MITKELINDADEKVRSLYVEVSSLGSENKKKIVVLDLYFNLYFNFIWFDINILFLPL